MLFSCSSDESNIEEAFKTKGYTSIDPPVRSGNFYSPTGLTAPCAGLNEFCGVYAAKNSQGKDVYVLTRIEKDGNVSLREIGDKEKEDWFDALHGN
jgi:hypothetical protein